tara:strand:+ start:2000 stop:2236 length:237 start_codon:yes stop_codon:yes gene_type:complete
MLLWFSVVINKKLSKKHGWEPFWFNSKTFDRKLVENVKNFQKNNGLFPSGWCGRKTYRKALLRVLIGIKKRNTNYKRW